MNLIELEESGICKGCSYYKVIDDDGKKACTFHWDDDESEDWELCGECIEVQGFR